MTGRDPINRREFLRCTPRPRIIEVSCERLYMKYADARSEGRLLEFLRSVLRELEGADGVRVTSRDWLARDDFRADVEPLLQANGACSGRRSSIRVTDARSTPA